MSVLEISGKDDEDLKITFSQNLPHKKYRLNFQIRMIPDEEFGFCRKIDKALNIMGVRSMGYMHNIYFKFECYFFETYWLLL